MALATQCPHCGTMFRVASDQLKLRGGIVRCGSCHEIFDGSATLVDLDALPAKAPVAAPPDSAPPVPAPPEPAAAPAAADSLPSPASGVAPQPAPAAQAEVYVDRRRPAPEDEVEPLAPLEVAVELPRFEDQPVYTLDFDHTFDPFGILPKVDAPDDAPAPDDEPDEEPVQPAMPPWSQLLKNPEPVPEAPPAATPVADTETAPVADVVSEPAASTPPPDEVAEPTQQPQGAAEPAPVARQAFEPAPPDTGRIEPAFGLPVDEELVALALPGHEPDHEPDHAPELEAAPESSARTKTPLDDAPPLLMRESTASVITPPAAAHVPPVAARTPAAKRAEKAAARRSKLTPTRIEAQPKLRAAEIDEPEFVKRSRQQEENGRARKIALIAGAIGLAVLLLAQGVLSFRNTLAARFPAAKPALVVGCAVFGCRVELPAQIDNLAIETGELTTLGGGAYSYTTELRNAGSTAQAWPSLELALTDANDKPLVRRVFAPADYLAAGTAGANSAANGIAPRAEHAIKLHFRVDDLKPSGYHIAVFYP